MAADPTLFNLPLQAATRRLGHLGQLARLDALSYDDGPQRGSRLLRLSSGGGLQLDLHPDRALDIGQVEVAGVPLAWMSPTEVAAPGLVGSREHDFLRSFGGGFLATCGLDHFGGPCQDEGQAFPQHGRIGGMPARVVRADRVEGAWVVEGVVVQAAVHQEHLELRRQIRVPLGGRTIELHDTVTNLGSRRQPHMILYHCNFGWPLLSEDARVRVEHATQAPHTDEASGEPWDQLGPPMRGQNERCWLHTFAGQTAQVLLENPTHGLTMRMHIDATTLPGMCEWKMLSENQYVLGLEPTNTLDLGGRAHARSTQRLKFLEPGASVHYRLRWELDKA